MQSSLAKWTALGALFLAVWAAPGQAAPQPLEDLRGVRALAIDPTDPTRLYLATGDGLYLTDPQKRAELVARTGDNLVALIAVPGAGETMLASGHPAIGGNLGLLRSTDGGRSWEARPAGADGPMAFELLAASKARPRLVYGIYQGLRASQDGGETWQKVAAAPPQLYDLAVSQRDPKALYAATGGGLYASSDGGRSWRDPFEFKLPVSMVRATADGQLYAFVLGKGLLRAREGQRDWTPLNNALGAQVLVKLVVSPRDRDRLYALNQFDRVLASADGGKSWHSFAGDRKPSTKNALRGQQLYAAQCQACHGPVGIGETYSVQSLTERDYLMAPALDDSMHAWHHTDDDLVKTILNGSSRKSRMVGFKNVLSEADARDIVQYLKSLWGARALACQGPKHMQCM